MAQCEVCGNDYDKAFEVTTRTRRLVRSRTGCSPTSLTRQPSGANTSLAEQSASQAGTALDEPATAGRARPLAMRRIAIGSRCTRSRSRRSRYRKVLNVMRSRLG